MPINGVTPCQMPNRPTACSLPAGGARSPFCRGASCQLARPFIFGFQNSDAATRGLRWPSSVPYNGPLRNLRRFSRRRLVNRFEPVGRFDRRRVVCPAVDLGDRLARLEQKGRPPFAFPCCRPISGPSNYETLAIPVIAHRLRHSPIMRGLPRVAVFRKEAAQAVCRCEGKASVSPKRAMVVRPPARPRRFQPRSYISTGGN